jgi:peroxiredoxin
MSFSMTTTLSSIPNPPSSPRLFPTLRLFALAASSILFLLSACTGGQVKEDKVGSSQNPSKSKWVEQKGSPAPDFRLQDLRGEAQALSQFKGKVLLINFWATWCAPCLKELQHFQQMHESMQKDGLEILAISIDEAQTVSQVGPLINRYGYTFRVLLDTEGRVVTLYNPNRHSPYSVLVDRKGQIRMTHEGYTPGDEIAMKNKLKALLEETASK